MEEQKQEGSGQSPPEEISLGQKLFDNMFLLLILSFLISFVLYNVWGLIETLGVPPAP
jgi:hypothetical protein